MYCKYLFTLVFTLIYILNAQGQKLTDEQKERLDYKVDIFSYQEKELQQLWYEDRMDLMKLKGELREDYRNIVEYHSYKMSRLDDMDKKSEDIKIPKLFQKQLTMLHDDVRSILNNEQFEIHKKSWEAIVNAVYRRKNWNKDD